MSRKLRTFVALELSPAICHGAAKLIDQLRASGASVRWVETDHLHLTLKFLGDVDELEIAAVCRQAGLAAASQPAFTADVRGAGAFPSLSQPRIVWLGVDHGAEPLVALHEALETRLATLGYPREARRFSPHVTLGRVKGGGQGLAELGRLLGKHADFYAGAVEVDEIVVFSSELSREGPRYTALAHLPLG